MLMFVTLFLDHYNVYALLKNGHFQNRLHDRMVENEPASDFAVFSQYDFKVHIHGNDVYKTTCFAFSLKVYSLSESIFSFIV